MKLAGYRVRVRFPHNASPFYLIENVGYFVPEWNLSASHDALRLTPAREGACIWTRKSKALAAAACLQAQHERDGLEASIGVTSVSLSDNSPCWEKVIR